MSSQCKLARLFSPRAAAEPNHGRAAKSASGGRRGIRGPLAMQSRGQEAAPVQTEELGGLGSLESWGLKHRFGTPTPLLSHYTNPKHGQTPTVAQKCLHFQISVPEFIVIRLPLQLVP